jgi:hypothetical protein
MKNGMQMKKYISYLESRCSRTCPIILGIIWLKYFFDDTIALNLLRHIQKLSGLITFFKSGTT